MCEIEEGKNGREKIFDRFGENVGQQLSHMLKVSGEKRWKKGGGSVLS